MQEKIAIITDSGSDLNNQYLEDFPIFKLPLQIIIDGQQYTEGKEISELEVYQAMETTKVSTSLPSPTDILATLDQLKQSGFTHVIAIVISSGLSGTYNTIKLLSESYQGLIIEVVDTKNISMATGFSVLQAAQMVKNQMTFSDIVKTINHDITKKKVFFTVGTLDYLKKGGRIGLVAGTVAELLHIKPIISCNADGVYYTVKKIRGYRKSIQLMLDQARQYIGNALSYQVVLLNAQSQENINAILAKIKELFPLATSIKLEKVSLALAIHTGPEALGIAIHLD